MITKYFGNSIEDAERLAGLNVTFLMMEVRLYFVNLCENELRNVAVNTHRLPEVLGSHPVVGTVHAACSWFFLVGSVLIALNNVRCALIPSHGGKNISHSVKSVPLPNSWRNLINGQGLLTFRSADVFFAVRVYYLFLH